MNETKNIIPNSCYDCKYSAFGNEIICVVSDKLFNVYDFDKSIHHNCPKKYHKKMSVRETVLIQNEIDEIERIMHENSETIKFKIENGIQYYINGYEVRDLENRLNELKKLIAE